MICKDAEDQTKVHLKDSPGRRTLVHKHTTLVYENLEMLIWNLRASCFEWAPLLHLPCPHREPLLFLPSSQSKQRPHISSRIALHGLYSFFICISWGYFILTIVIDDPRDLSWVRSKTTNPAPDVNQQSPTPHCLLSPNWWDLQAISLKSICLIWASGMFRERFS